jgi:guanylate kinase
MTRGTLFVIAAPSGTGKTTLVKQLLQSLANITVSISHTTRKKRENEIADRDYYFISREEFEHRIAQNDFLEYATIFSNLYGTSKQWVNKTLEEGKDVILEIDWQGYQQVKLLFPDTIGIFILPPSATVLRNRLMQRNQDVAEIIQKRLQDTAEAVSHLTEFNYIVVNDMLSQATSDLKHIVLAARLSKTKQVVRFAQLIESLMTSV